MNSNENSWVYYSSFLGIMLSIYCTFQPLHTSELIFTFNDLNKKKIFYIDLHLNDFLIAFMHALAQAPPQPLQQPIAKALALQFSIQA